MILGFTLYILAPGYIDHVTRVIPKRYFGIIIYLFILDLRISVADLAFKEEIKLLIWKK